MVVLLQVVCGRSLTQVAYLIISLSLSLSPFLPYIDCSSLSLLSSSLDPPFPSPSSCHHQHAAGILYIINQEK